MHAYQTLTTRLAETREAITQETSGQYWNERTVNVESDAKTMVVNALSSLREAPYCFPYNSLVGIRIPSMKHQASQILAMRIGKGSESTQHPWQGMKEPLTSSRGGLTSKEN